MLIKETSTPVVVLSSEREGGVGITRSLGRLGVPVYSVGVHRWTPAFFSKYSGGKFIWDLDSASAEQSVCYLTEVGEKIGRRSILVPTTDNAAMFVAEHAKCLAEWFIFSDRSAGLLRSLCSKKGMYCLAKKCGVPTPETAFPQSRDDVLKYVETASFPIMLKGIYGKRLEQRVGSRMFIVRTEAELLERYDAIEDVSDPNLMLQEYIPGGDDMTWTFDGYFDKQGDCHVAFTGKKIRQFPAYTGRTCLGICLRNDHVAETTIQFMNAIGYRGILDIGYRFDARDGQYKVIDVNPRIGSTFRLFVGDNGMDVVRALYQDLTGQPVVPAVTVEGRRWLIEDMDLISSVRYYLDGRLTFKEWINSFRGVEEVAYFSKDDLGPVAGEIMANARALFKRARVTPSLLSGMWRKMS